MWHTKLNNNKFISQLYNDEVPELTRVRILSMNSGEEGRKFLILFMMPKYVDNPPGKWRALGYNSILVELNFFDIEEISLTASNKKLGGEIKI